MIAAGGPAGGMMTVPPLMIPPGGGAYPQGMFSLHPPPGRGPTLNRPLHAIEVPTLKLYAPCTQSNVCPQCVFSLDRQPEKTPYYFLGKCGHSTVFRG